MYCKNSWELTTNLIKKALRRRRRVFSLTRLNFFVKIAFDDDFMGEIEIEKYIIEWDDDKAEINYKKTRNTL